MSDGAIKSRQKQAKQWIDSNVWDGSCCAGKDYSAIFGPDDLQELIDDLIEHLHRVKPGTPPTESTEG